MNGIKLFNDLMEYADGKGASDVHLVPGRTAMLRIDGELTAAGQEDAAEWQDADLTEVTEQILSGDQLEEYRTKGALVCSYSFSKALRLRVSVYRQQGRDAMSVRLHPAGVPMPEKLLLPEEITELVKNGRGLLLVHGRQRKRSDDDGGITCRTDCSNTVKGHCLCGGYDRIHPSAGKGTGCAAGDRSGLRFQGGSPCDGAAAGCRCDPSGWNRE